MSVGENIKKYRIAKGLTQKQLANKLGLAEITIRQYENKSRTPKLETLKKIALVFNILLSELIGDNWDLYSEEDYNNFSSAKIEEITMDGQTFTNPEDYQNFLFEKITLTNLQKLNLAGKRKIADYSTDLAKVPEYQKKPDE